MNPGIKSPHRISRVIILSFCVVLLHDPVLVAQGIPISEAERHDLDSVFQETPQVLAIVKEDSVCQCFQTDSDPTNKHITVSPYMLAKYARDYNISGGHLIQEGILAHEYGHIKQLERNPELIKRDNISFKEFHADFMAGFYVSNKYKLKFMANPSPTTDQIFGQVCEFMRHRQENPELYLMLAMLINSDYERHETSPMTRQEYGLGVDTVRAMRFASVWDGFRHSSASTFDDAYRVGYERTDRLLKVKTDDGTVRVFLILGYDLVLSILKGDVDYKGGIDRMIDRLKNSKAAIPEPTNSAYRLELKLYRSYCDRH